MEKAVKLKDGVFWVGARDYDIRVFDIVMRTEHGTTYNAYIVKGGKKTALIDVSKDRFFGEFIERVSSAVKPEDIDYIILSHTEPDHCGALAKLLEIVPGAEVIGSRAAINFAGQITNKSFKSRVVKEGDILELGGKTLEFITAPFLHWPDTMFTYLKEQKILFSCDFLGCHYCSGNTTNEEMDSAALDEAYKYYFDVILRPFRMYILSALDRIKDIETEMICVGHGPVLVKNIDKYKNLYREWATPVKREKLSATVFYVTAYGYTGELAVKIAEGLAEAGVLANMLDLTESNTEAIEKALSESDGFLIGSPTILGDTLPPVWELLSRINPIIHKGIYAGVFGSFGWSGEAIPNIEGRLNQLRLKMPLPPLRVNFRADSGDLEEAYQFGKNFGEHLITETSVGKL